MTDPPDRLKAALADRYSLEREIGAGGMATVYLAQDLKQHRQVAVKVLRPDLAATLGSERFLREVDIAVALLRRRPPARCLSEHESRPRLLEHGQYLSLHA